MKNIKRITKHRINVKLHEITCFKHQITSNHAIWANEVMFQPSNYHTTPSLPSLILKMSYKSFGIVVPVPAGSSLKSFKIDTKLSSQNYWHCLSFTHPTNDHK